jgi:hypothetical protein
MQSARPLLAVSAQHRGQCDRWDSWMLGCLEDRIWRCENDLSRTERRPHSHGEEWPNSNEHFIPAICFVLETISMFVSVDGHWKSISRRNERAWLRKISETQSTIKNDGYHHRCISFKMIACWQFSIRIFNHMYLPAWILWGSESMCFQWTGQKVFSAMTIFSTILTDCFTFSQVRKRCPAITIDQPSDIYI